MKYCFLVNPCAGSGKGKLAWQQIHSYLVKTGINYDYLLSQHPGHPRRLAAQLASNRGQTDCLVVVGGDGTLHEVITGLLETPQREQLPVAYIPAGTGNDFARGYGISVKPLQALR